MSEQQIPTSEVLNRAADLIEQRGWVQGDDGWAFSDRECAPLCLEGALMAAMGLSWEEDGVAEVDTCPAYKAVRDHLEEERRWLWHWNDDEHRTAHEVIATLRAVAVIEAAREQQPAEVQS